MRCARRQAARPRTRPDAENFGGEVSVEPPVTSFNHLVGARQQGGRDIETERLGGRQIDNEVELGRLLDWNVGRLRPAQNLVDEVRSAPELVLIALSIGHQTARFNVLPMAMHRRQSRAHRQDVDANPVSVQERVGTKIKCIRAVP